MVSANKAPGMKLERTNSGSATGLMSLKNKVFKSTADLGVFGAEASKQDFQRDVEDFVLEAERETGAGRQLVPTVLDLSGPLSGAAAAIVDDSFLRCFKSTVDEPWNWNAYLFPLWLLGVVVRNLILFPIRAIALLLGFVIFVIGFALVGLVLRGARRRAAERWLVRFMCVMFVVSWTGVIRYHGPRPMPAANRVWVANHTSMIDYIVLCAFSPFAAIMQLHPGWVGYLQTRYLNALGCLWFNRTQSKDRSLVARRMQEHVASPDTTPLLIFPEGTCVNNEYCVMFKRGAFDLGATVSPIAIKYNKIFVDAFWNSKRQSFSAHLFKLMRSWALVCDVYFLQPQSQGEGESSADFAARVQRLIADKARLKVAPWDGYLKYYNLGEKYPDLIEKQRRVFGDMVKQVAGFAPEQQQEGDEEEDSLEVEAGAGKED